MNTTKNLTALKVNYGYRAGDKVLDFDLVPLCPKLVAFLESIREFEIPQTSCGNPEHDGDNPSYIATYFEVQDGAKEGTIEACAVEFWDINHDERASEWSDEDCPLSEVDFCREQLGDIVLTGEVNAEVVAVINRLNPNHF